MKTFNRILDALLIGVAACAMVLLAAAHVVAIIIITIVRAAWRA